MKRFVTISIAVMLLSAIGFAANHFWFVKTLSFKQAGARCGPVEHVSE